MPPLGAGNSHAVNPGPAQQSVVLFWMQKHVRKQKTQLCSLLTTCMNSLKRRRSDSVDYYVNVPLSEE